LKPLNAQLAGRRGQERDEEIEKNGVDKDGQEARLARHDDAPATGRERQENTRGEEYE
jgi:hypothetical protein